jgi:hypothetical protein
VSRRGFHSIETAASAAQQAMASGRHAEAERAFRELIAQTHVVDYEYDDWLRGLADCYRHLGRGREAGFIYLYLHYFDQAKASLAAAPELRARLAEVEKRWADAATAWAEAGRPAHAAVAWDKAKIHDKARAGWEALAANAALRDRPYEQALVHFNIGSAIARLDPASPDARRALVEAQRRLEQVADDFEIAGELERAFDCFQIVLKLGKDSGQFENIALGYVNCIRVLAGDNLKFYVLQYYEDFVRLALERGELHARRRSTRRPRSTRSTSTCRTTAATRPRAPTPGSAAPTSTRPTACRWRWSRTRSWRRSSSTRRSATTSACAAASSGWPSSSWPRTSARATRRSPGATTARPAPPATRRRSPTT